MIKNFITSLFCNPKAGNGIARQVKRAGHKVAVEIAKANGDIAARTTTAIGGTMVASSLMHGSPTQLSFIPAIVGINSLALFGKGARKGITDAINHCKSLKASKEYQEILERAAKIKKVQ